MKFQSILAATIASAASIVSAQTITITASPAPTQVVRDVVSQGASLQLSLASQISSDLPGLTSDAGQLASSITSALGGVPSMVQGAPSQIASVATQAGNAIQSAANAEASVLNTITGHSDASKVNGVLHVAVIGVVAAAVGVAFVL